MKISRMKLELVQADRGMTAGQIAEKARVSRQNISTIKGRGTCAPATAAKLAKALGCDIKEIIGEE